ncbi:hypothetical protein ABIB38_004383, partial [Massilia sp. UYP11]|uniref:hypothetical protein n=1 Tax=Massilia sp. UYP11 TaxID=1756385 RepID=UPI003D204D53
GFHHDGTRWLGSMSGFYPAAGVSAEVFRGGLRPCLQFPENLFRIDPPIGPDMRKNLRQPGPGLAQNDAVLAAGNQRLREHKLIDIGPAVECSRVTTLLGRPYPVQFRHQGAIDAWTRALGTTEVWRRWQDPGTLCWQIRKEILRQFELARPERPLSGVMAEMLAEDMQRLAVEISVNLKYHLQKGTVIEATPALETLLTHSDVASVCR